MKAELLVGTSIYGGWQRVSVTRSIEQVANSFDLEVTERWPGQSTSRPIRPGEECTLKLDDETVITGYVDDAEPTFDRQSHGISVRGRDATGDLVDCSAVHKTGQWMNAPLDRIATDLCAPFKMASRSRRTWAIPSPASRSNRARLLLSASSAPHGSRPCC